MSDRFCHLTFMRRFFTTTYLTPISSQPGEIHLWANRRRWKLVWIFQPRKWWQKFFGIHAVYSLRKVKAMVNIMPTYRIGSTTLRRKSQKELGYDLLSYALCFPDLASSGYFLFPNLKKWLGQDKFYFIDEIITQTNTNFEFLEKTFNFEALKRLKKKTMFH